MVDERTSANLSQFNSIVGLLQFRVQKHPDELAYCTIDAKGREGKGVTWRKLDLKIAAVANYLRNRVYLKEGQRAVLIYTHSEEYLYAVHACLALGVTPIPIAPLDSTRLYEDVPALLNVLIEFKVSAILVNNDAEHALKAKTIWLHLKQSAVAASVTIPPIFNTSKPSKQSKGCKELGFVTKESHLHPDFAALVWIYWSSDHRRTAIWLGHDTILACCKVQKETCQMTSSRPAVGCVRSYYGLGFLHSCCMGIYNGTATYFLSPVDFAANPLLLLQIFSRYKIKDTYATTQMLEQSMAGQGRGFSLHEMKNIMVMFDGRPRTDIFGRARQYFAQSGLDANTIYTIYSHVMNPMIATRSYMFTEPVQLTLDRSALRRGYVHIIDPQYESSSLTLQDSGMVPVATQVAIVNPESGTLCSRGEYGEIWVSSEACAKGFYGGPDAFGATRFNARIGSTDGGALFARTGDIGFLHTVTRAIGIGGASVDLQTLFVLGSIGDTFEVNGLLYFPNDVERTVERSHRRVIKGRSAVFFAGGRTVAVVEVSGPPDYLASVVPIIVNAVLEEQQLLLDIVCFVARGDFPMSRLGEKQRGKILASWVTRKL